MTILHFLFRNPALAFQLVVLVLVSRKLFSRKIIFLLNNFTDRIFIPHPTLHIPHWNRVRGRRTATRWRDLPWTLSLRSRVTERQGSMSRPRIRSGVTRGEQHPTRPLAGERPKGRDVSFFTMRFVHTEHENLVFCGLNAFIYIKGVDKKGTNHETRDDYDDAWYGCGACRV